MAKKGYEERILPRIEEIKQYRRDGKTIKEISDLLGYNYNYFVGLSTKHKELSEALSELPVNAINSARKTLLKMATGYEAPSEKTVTVTKDECGAVVSTVIKTVTKMYQPNIRALSLWLVNNDPDFITERQDNRNTAAEIENSYYNEKENGNG